MLKVLLGPLYKLTLDLTVPIPSYRAAYLTKIKKIVKILTPVACQILYSNINAHHFWPSMASKFELYHRTLVPQIEVITTVNTVIIIHV